LERGRLFLKAGPDGPTQQFGVALVQKINHADLLPKARNVLDWEIEEIGSPGLGVDDPPVLVHAVFYQPEEGIARLVPRRLRAEDHEVAGVRVGDDVADELLDANVFSLDGARESGSAFQANPDQALDVRGNLFLVVKQDDSHGDGRIVVAPEIAPFFRRIAKCWLHLQHGFPASVSAKR
jgi:hypothetical protein